MSLSRVWATIDVCLDQAAANWWWPSVLLLLRISARQPVSGLTWSRLLEDSSPARALSTGCTTVVVAGVQWTIHEADFSWRCSNILAPLLISIGCCPPVSPPSCSSLSVVGDDASWSLWAARKSLTSRLQSSGLKKEGLSNRLGCGKHSSLFIVWSDFHLMCCKER